jgi:hypothetical protein
MKRVVRVTDPGKVKDLGWHGLEEAPEVASLDANRSSLPRDDPGGVGGRGTRSPGRLRGTHESGSEAKP